jgi:cell wall-associated NlpC family hydrolase
MKSLITPPPNILGVPVSHPGLLPTSVDNLLVNGAKGWAENIGDALTNLSISFDIDGTSTIIAQVEDPQRALLRSSLGLERTVMTIDGVSFIMAVIDKQGPQITLTFEHAVCSRLKDHTDTVAVMAQTMSRTDFCKKLVAYESWINVALPGGPSPGTSVVILSTGNVDSTTGGALPLPYATTYTELETFWDATGTILGTIGWRRFPLGVNTLVMVSDQWLYTQPPIATIDESDEGILSIDFNWDIRKPLGSLTITCDASRWAYPVGSLIAFTPKMGIAGVQNDLSLRFSPNPNIPPANGHWLVTNISRSLMSALATITLDVPNLTLTEVQTQPPTSAAAQVNPGSAPVSGQMSSLAWAQGLLLALQSAGYPAPTCADNIANIQRQIGAESAGNNTPLPGTLGPVGFLRDNNPWNLNTHPGTQSSMTGGHMVQAFGSNIQVFDSVSQGYLAYITQLEANPALLAAINSCATPTAYGTALESSGWSGQAYANRTTFPTLTPFTGSSAVTSPLALLPGGAQTGKNPTPKVAAFVNFCLNHTTAASGCTYYWGATGPKQFDCSGLVLAAMQSIGITGSPHNSDAMYAWAKSAGYAISVDTAIKTYGAVLILSSTKDQTLSPPGNGHAAVSLGNGQLVNAADPAIGIVTGPVPTGFFDEAFLLPGIAY